MFISCHLSAGIAGRFEEFQLEVLFKEVKKKVKAFRSVLAESIQSQEAQLSHHQRCDSLGSGNWKTFSRRGK